jgi:7,8-dihydropterin-6-yl-methyl-4-(beta-D-ribofuranosyl)aminobenzene 5'-phosphate synthase
MIIGGFHMRDSSDDQYSFITRYLKKANPEMLGVSHCTGIEKYASLRNDLEAKVFYNFTGNEITLK